MTKRVYILGIGGTLMGSIAQLAQAAGYEVTGSDKVLYPPMSDQLEAANITVYEGFDPAHLVPAPDLVIVGNAGLHRGHPGIEYLLERGLAFTSGAQWLGEELLKDRWVVAVAGTHGKTTTASMLAWILEYAGLRPGYLIGGVPKNFGVSARLPIADSTGDEDSPFFVIEADEYDTSFFDRRSKFVHYHPRTLIINNLEYDHADIFEDLSAIQTQFHNLLRWIPHNGLVVAPGADNHVIDTLQMGCWANLAWLGARPTDGRTDGQLWRSANIASDGSRFDVVLDDVVQGRLTWSQMGKHNVFNALAAIAAARHVGVPAQQACDALARFSGVARRMDLIAQVGQVAVYDDFAHHPTAIRTTLRGLRNKVGNEEIIAVIEPRSHTMSLGTLRGDLTTCCDAADRVFWFRGDNIKWDLGEVVNQCVVPAQQFDDLDTLIAALVNLPRKKRHILLMSNGAFGGIYEKLPPALRAN